MSYSETKVPIDSDQLTENKILEFIKQNPDFLEKNLESLIPEKKRGTRGKPADFQAYVIDRLKNDKEEIIENTRELVENSRANMNNQVRIQSAVIRLLEANNFSDFIQCVTMDISSILDVDITALVVEADGTHIPHIDNAGIRIIPEGTVDKWMLNEYTLLQDNISGIEAVFGGGAALVRSQLLLRLDIAPETPPAILAFGSRDPNAFNKDQATDQISFLARVIERCMRIWLIT